MFKFYAAVKKTPNFKASSRPMAAATISTISEVLGLWAIKARELMKKSNKKKVFKPIDLGKPKIDLSNRKNWGI